MKYNFTAINLANLNKQKTNAEEPLGKQENLSSLSEGTQLIYKEKSLSCVRIFLTPWAEAHLASLSMGFSRQEYWNGLPCPSPGDLPDPGIEPRSTALQADALPSEPPRKSSVNLQLVVIKDAYFLHPFPEEFIIQKKMFKKQ